MARKRFVTDLLDALVRDQAARLERPLDDEELRHGPGELWRQQPVRAALDALWPELTPYRLIGELLSDAGVLRCAAAGLTDAEQAARSRLGSGPRSRYVGKGAGLVPSRRPMAVSRSRWCTPWPRNWPRWRPRTVAVSR
ncbi:hypothetical protein ABZ746_34795 [Streptomyces sp. NPDC020096]